MFLVEKVVNKFKFGSGIKYGLIYNQFYDFYMLGYVVSVGDSGFWVRIYLIEDV